MTDDRCTRRRTLRAIGAICVGTALAGCIGSETDANAEPTEKSASPTAPSTETAARTEAAPTRTSERPASTATADLSTDPSTEASETRTSPADGSDAERGPYTVEMHTDLYFDPVGLYVEPGETVSFELVSGVHGATAYHPANEAAFDRRVPDGAPAWDTGVFDTEGAFRNVTFETPGTHDYYCQPHKQLGMIGRIVVGEPGGPAEDGSNPDGELPDSNAIVDEGSIPHGAFSG